MCPQEATRSLAVPKEESWRFPPATDSVGLDVSWTCSELRWKKNLHRFFESFMGHQKNLQAKRSDSFCFKEIFFKISSYFCWILLHWDEIEDRISSIDCPLLVPTEPPGRRLSWSVLRLSAWPWSGSTICQVWNAWSQAENVLEQPNPHWHIGKTKMVSTVQLASIFWYRFWKCFFVDSCKSPQLTFVSQRVVATNLDSLAESPDP